MTFRKNIDELTGSETQLLKAYIENFTSAENDISVSEEEEQGDVITLSISDMIDQTESRTDNNDTEYSDGPSVEKSEYTFVTQQGDYFLSTGKKTKILEGEVESIQEDYAIIVLKVNNIFYERIIPLERLKSIKSNYAGARIRLIIKEDNNSVTSIIEKMEEPPLWAQPDEKVKTIFNKLHRNNKRT